MKQPLQKPLAFVLILTLMVTWVFSGWPQIQLEYGNLSVSFPPSVERAHAAATPVVEATNTSAELGKTTSHSVALPASIAAGDELIVAFAAKGTTFNLPSGWTELYNSGSAFPGLFVIRREADGGEGATLTVTTGGSQKSAHASYRISGAVASEISTAATGTSVNPDPPSLTPSGGALDYLWLAIDSNEGGATVSAYPTNYTDGFQSANPGETIESARRELNAASENPGTFTISGSFNWRAVTVAVPPGAVAPAVSTTFASNIGATSATLNGAVTDTGGASVTQHGFAKSTSATLSTGVSTSTLGSLSDISRFSEATSTPGENTTYYFRAYATNSGGTGYGSILSFVTGNSNVTRTVRLFGTIASGQTLNIFGERSIIVYPQ